MKSILFILVSLTVLLSLGCQESESQESIPIKKESIQFHQSKAIQQTETHSVHSQLEEVPAKLVCMVNNNFMGIDQIEVKVEGKVYYGCCADCEGKLKKNVSQRFAIDPVTQEKVDKSLAIIGKLPNNKVLYFANKENFQNYGK